MNRLKWRWYFRDNDGTKPLVNRKRVATPAAPKVFNEERLPDELEAWCRLTSSRIVTAAQNAISRSPCAGNAIPLVRYALRLLKKSQWHLMKNDKDGGRCAMSKGEARAAHLEVLNNHLYDELYVDHLVQPSVTAEYRGICKDIASLEDDASLIKHLMKGFSCERMVANLSTLVKSHKEDGLVSFRAIHGMSNYGAEGMSAWLIYKLRPFIRSLPHILTDSADLVNRLRCLTWKTSYKSGKLDVKDFHLKGKHGDLAALTSSPCQGTIQFWWNW